MSRQTKKTVVAIVIAVNCTLVLLIHLSTFTSTCDPPSRINEKEGALHHSKYIRIKVNDKYEYSPYSPIPILRGSKNMARISKGECLPERKTSIKMLEMIAVTNYIPIDILREKHTIYTVITRMRGQLR